MEKLYFLLIVAACVAAVLLLVWKTEKKHRAKVKASRKKLKRKARLHYAHESGVRHGVHSHLETSPANQHDAWSIRKQRAGEERRDGTSFAAARVYTDEENPDSVPATGLQMGAIEYTPEDLPKSVRNRR